MKKLSSGVAKKLLRMIEGESVAHSQMQHVLIEQMIADGVLFVRSSGSRKTVYCRDTTGLQNYINNHFGVPDISRFVAATVEPDLQRSTAVRVSANSKMKRIRSFKGFLVNSWQPIAAELNGIPIEILPPTGTFTYIHDFEGFVPAADVTIIGVENGENFRYIERQQRLFPFAKVLFVSRYPQSGDLLKWLQQLPNRYVHFGDFDFAGINIYLHEFKNHLGTRAEFFVPDNIAELLRTYGSRELYQRQLNTAPQRELLPEPALKILLDLLCTEKKGLEQEVLIEGQ
ncbi:MAG: hypothetical protein J7K09_07100 [Desulfuromusa sp.]|nr:hypothetical protein [Desulfuromusa sp.]